MRPAYATLQYETSGEDVYRVESTGTVSRVSYRGSEQLTIGREGAAVRFQARAHYTRDVPGERTNQDALFVQIMRPDGSFEDRVDNDPDFLTILNQPFAIELDAATLRDLRDLHGRVPFDATSPLGGENLLHGFLRPGASGPIQGRPTVAVRFQADGPMTGELPGHAGATVSGSMRMDGTAYYALSDAILLGLKATLTIEASLHERHSTTAMPVRITYTRSIRAAP
ncbi:MAG: hypothetical protein WA814_12550 [Candidatus Baltobacteraceae bacterium]